MKAMVGGCCVCSDECGWKENPLVYCDGRGCNVAVHQACYGIISVPSGPWYCRKCESQERAARVKCELCPQKDGALKRTDSGGWCHVLCALYIPEASFQNVETMEPIVLKCVLHERFNKVCYICEEQKRDPTKINYGACMQCHKVGCRYFFHVTCAQSQGLLCEMSGTRGGNVKYIAYCVNHCKRLKKDSNNIKIIPAFTPIREESALSDSSPEKRENGPSKLEKEKKMCQRSADPSPSSTEPMEVQEAPRPTKGKETVKLNHSSASQDTQTPQNVPRARTRKQLPSRLENSSPESVTVSSASDSLSTSTATVTSPENLFTAVSDSLLSNGRSSGIFGSSAAVCSSNGLAQQSVIVPNDSEPSTSKKGAGPSTSKVKGQKSSTVSTPQSSTSETAEGKQLSSKSRVHRGRKGKKAAQPFTKKKGGASRRIENADSNAPSEVISDGMQELAVTASTPGSPITGATVFGGGPCFQSPIPLSNFSSPEGEMPNGATAFSRPLPPDIVPCQPVHADNGKTPSSFPEMMQHHLGSLSALIMDQSQQFDVAALLKEVQDLKTKNLQLEEEVSKLMTHRDSLLKTNSKLSVPITTTPPHSLLHPEAVELPSANNDLHGDRLLVTNSQLAAPIATTPPRTLPHPEVARVELPSANNDMNFMERDDEPGTSEALNTTATPEPSYMPVKQTSAPNSVQGSASLLEHSPHCTCEVTQQQCRAPSGRMASWQPNSSLWTAGSEGATEQNWNSMDQGPHQRVT